jgi:hypothetical protein
MICSLMDTCIRVQLRYIIYLASLDEKKRLRSLILHSTGPTFTQFGSVTKSRHFPPPDGQRQKRRQGFVAGLGHSLIAGQVSKRVESHNSRAARGPSRANPPPEQNNTSHLNSRTSPRLTFINSSIPTSWPTKTRRKLRRSVC